MSTTYGGFRNERIGFLGGASVLQVAGVLVTSLPAWWSVTQQRWLPALFWMAVFLVIAAAVFARVKDRALYVWATQSVLHLVGRVSGTSEWRARAAGGGVTREEIDRLDLPGPLAAMRVHDGPPLASQAMQRVCLIQDGKHWVVVASMTHPGLSIADPGSAGRYADALGSMLANLARNESGASRLSLYVRAMPDDGAERAAWHAEHARTDVPSELIEATDRLERVVLSASIRHEIYVAVRFEDGAIRKPAKAAGGGVPGRAAVIYRVLSDVEAGLTSVGCQRIQWLSTQQVAGAIRSGYNPGDAASMAVARTGNVRGGEAFADMEPGGAGPSQAPSPAPRSYTHDAFRTVAYTLLLPDLGTQVGRLRPLLTPARQQERRCLALHYEPMTVQEAEKKTERDNSKATMASEIKRQKGFRVSARQRKLKAQTEADENLLTAGHTMVRVAGAVSVTAPAEEEIETNAALIESAARSSGYALMRLDLAQDAGFVAATIPVGVGLPTRGG